MQPGTIAGISGAHALGTDEVGRDILSIGPIVLHLGTITDDGETVVYEYMADRWGAEPMTPQAGAAAYQRGPSGKLAWARIYDDVQPPAGQRRGPCPRPENIIQARGSSEPAMSTLPKVGSVR